MPLNPFPAPDAGSVRSGTGKVLGHAIACNAHRPRGGWRVAAATDEAGHTCAHDRADRGDVTVLDGGERGRLRAAIRRVDQHDIRCLARFQASAVETVYGSIIPCGGAEELLGTALGEARAVGDGVEHTQRHDPAARRRVGGDDEAIEGVHAARKVGAQERGAQVAGRAHLERDIRLGDDALEIAIGHGGRPAVDMKRDVRADGEEMVAGDRARSRDRRSARVTGRDHAGRPGSRNQRCVLVSRLHGPEARLGKPHALAGNLLEVLGREPRLENDRARVHPHPTRPIRGKAALRGHRQRFHAFGILRPPRRVHFRCRYRRRHAAVQVAFQEPDGALARRVVAEGNVHVAVDQPRDRRRAVGIDDDVAGLDLGGRRRADAGDAPAFGDDRVPHHQGRAPVARDDRCNVRDGDAHRATRRRSAPTSRGRSPRADPPPCRPHPPSRRSGSCAPS